MFKWLCIIIGYLVIVSVFMGFFIFESTGERVNTLSPTTYISDAVDFTGTVDLSILLDTSLGGSEYCKIINNTLVISPPLIGDVSVFFNGIQPDANGLYSVEYGINNSADADFSIIITSETSRLSPMMLSFRHQAITDKNEILYTPNTVYDQFFATSLFTKYINLDGVHTIKSEFNINTHLLVVTVDDVEFCALTISDFDNSDIVHYGGGVISDNFIINFVKTNIVYVPEDVTDSNFFVIIAQILAWNVSEAYLPNALNVIFIKIPMLCLGIAIALYVRGIS